MIAMSYMCTSGLSCESMTVEYRAPRVSEYGYAHPASVWMTMSSDKTSVRFSVDLDIEHVRQLAEVLPGLLMAHDAAEHDKAVVSAAAEIDSAHKAA